MEKADNNIVESSEDSKKFSWYTLRVISGKEKKIKETILFELNTANLNESVENILVPTENVLEMRDGKKKIKEKLRYMTIISGTGKYVDRIGNKGEYTLGVFDREKGYGNFSGKWY